MSYRDILIHTDIPGNSVLILTSPHDFRNGWPAMLGPFEWSAKLLMPRMPAGHWSGRSLWLWTSDTAGGWRRASAAKRSGETSGHPLGTGDERQISLAESSENEDFLKSHFKHLGVL